MSWIIIIRSIYSMLAAAVQLDKKKSLILTVYLLSVAYKILKLTLLQQVDFCVALNILAFDCGGDFWCIQGVYIDDLYVEHRKRKNSGLKISG